MMGNKPLQSAAHAPQRLVAEQCAQIPASHRQVVGVREFLQSQFTTLEFLDDFPNLAFICIGDMRHTAAPFEQKKIARAQAAHGRYLLEDSDYRGRRWLSSS
jgi:hypothetical protein